MVAVAFYVYTKRTAPYQQSFRALFRLMASAAGGRAILFITLFRIFFVRFYMCCWTVIFCFPFPANRMIPVVYFHIQRKKRIYNCCMVGERHTYPSNWKDTTYKCWTGLSRLFIYIRTSTETTNLYIISYSSNIIHWCATVLNSYFQGTSLLLRVGLLMIYKLDTHSTFILDAADDVQPTSSISRGDAAEYYISADLQVSQPFYCNLLLLHPKRQ